MLVIVLGQNKLTMQDENDNDILLAKEPVFFFFFLPFKKLLNLVIFNPIVHFLEKVH